MLILGIDPGLAATGYGLIEKRKKSIKLINYGIWRTSKEEIYPDRLIALYEQIEKFLMQYKYKIKVGAVEKVFFYKNAKTAITIGETRGVVLLSLAKNNIPIVEYTPSEVKQKIVGFGRANKLSIIKKVKELLKINHLPLPDDAADALAVAISCSLSLKDLKLA